MDAEDSLRIYDDRASILKKGDIFSAMDKVRLNLAGDDGEYITGLQLLKNALSIIFNDVTTRSAKLEFSLYRRRFSFTLPFLDEVKVAQFTVSSRHEQNARRIEMTEVQVGSLLACFNEMLENHTLLSPEELAEYKLEKLIDISGTTNLVELRSAEEAFLS